MVQENPKIVKRGYAIWITVKHQVRQTCPEPCAHTAPNIVATFLYRAFFANPSALYRGQKPQNQENRVSESKNPRFLAPQKRASRVKEIPIFPVVPRIEMGIFFASERAFLGWGEMGILHTGKLGSICHFPRALPASIWGHCSPQVLVFTSIWGTQNGVVTTCRAVFPSIWDLPTLQNKGKRKMTKSTLF